MDDGFDSQGGKTVDVPLRELAGRPEPGEAGCVFSASMRQPSHRPVEFGQGGGELGRGHRLAQGGHLGVGPGVAAFVERVAGVALEPVPFDAGSRLTIDKSNE